jgi:acetylornithine deacetylase/succinyl-diaminopimelate desuccinylase-like protein
MSSASTPAGIPDLGAAQRLIAETWDQQILPSISAYIQIPNKSPAFDAEWKAHGHMDRAVEHIAAWCRGRNLPGLTLEVIRLQDEQGRDRTPLIFMELPGKGAAAADTVLLYGHLDKQPEMVGWSEGLDPWKPVLRGDKLYGRGSADDGYASYASLTALEALVRQDVPRARAVVLIEACEESGSYDLPAYVDHLAARIGTPSLVVCLDSGCGDYDRMWGTTSLRGMVIGNLTVEVLREGVHSGDASGIVPSSFRILRKLIARIEDQDTGKILLPELHVEIPADRRAQAGKVAEVVGTDLYTRLPFLPGMKPMADDLVELVLNRTWRPTLSVTGMDGIPSTRDGGNVLRPRTVAKLSIRVPPTGNAAAAGARVKQVLEADPPYGAKVSFSYQADSGWNAPAFAPWLEQAVDAASRATFGKPAVYYGEGGSIPFMGMLGAKFPKAQFLITGLLGPGSNAHGPNEFLHLPTGKNLTAAVALVIAAHAAARD